MGLREAFVPMAIIETSPEKPLRLVTETLAEPEFPDPMASIVGSTDILNVDELGRGDCITVREILWIRAHPNFASLQRQHTPGYSPLLRNR